MKKRLALFALLAFSLPSYAGTVNSVSVDNNTVTIEHTGNIEYKILTPGDLKHSDIYVVDIVAPDHVFDTKSHVYKPKNSVIKKVVTAWHYFDTEKLYHVPFLRVTVHIDSKKFKPKLTDDNNTLKVVFTDPPQSQVNPADLQLRQEQEFLKKLKAQQKELKTISKPAVKLVDNNTKHSNKKDNATKPYITALHPKSCSAHKNSGHVCMPKPKKGFSSTNPASQPKFDQHPKSNIYNPYNPSEPAYKVYSSMYRVPPPPRYTHLKKKVLKVLPDTFINPDVITKVEVSNVDVNRIVSPEPIKDIVYSKEKGLMVNYVGKNAFIKFVIKANPDGTYDYIQEPSEVYIVTQDAVYTLILKPSQVAGRTIRLSGGTLKKIQANENMFSQLPYEKKIIKIIKSVYKNDIPDTWDVSHPQNPKPIILPNGLTAKLITTVKIEGTGFNLKEYEITGSTPISISETDFLNTKLARHPKAISLTGFKVSKDEPVYLLIVAGEGDNE
ncbi:TraK domain-containing protein [Hippea maritima]|uniref:AMIN domain-containing protein n=1 Tax=Hippea maritima (strain ATCC 700847 / DSM 10411 / MH2) TaxID=760142 RepID=F2LV24_HIPMA|nr:type-F conjugative transfer system secretin TraK [Hippea maritima]AEA33608.1 hypothetical protein Hipma_0638 [Hippea maritima DSM 10411]